MGEGQERREIPRFPEETSRVRRGGSESRQRRTEVQTCSVKEQRAVSGRKGGRRCVLRGRAWEGRRGQPRGAPAGTGGPERPRRPAAAAPRVRSQVRRSPRGARGGAGTLLARGRAAGSAFTTHRESQAHASLTTLQPLPLIFLNK